MDEDRFEAKVDRSGEHHLWLGAVDARGAPQVRIAGRLTTARRVAWELVHGPLHPRVTVARCVEDRRCVRVDHLALGRRRQPAPRLDATPKRRSRRGGGSMREVRPQVWELSITVAVPGEGSRRLYRTVHGDAIDAASALFVFRADRGTGGDTVDAVVADHLVRLQKEGRSDATLRRYRQLWRQWLSPAMSRISPEALTGAQISAALGSMAAAGQSRRSVHQAAVVISSALAWAERDGRVGHNAATGVVLPDGTRLGPPRQRPAR